MTLYSQRLGFTKPDAPKLRKALYAWHNASTTKHCRLEGKVSDALATYWQAAYEELGWGLMPPTALASWSSEGLSVPSDFAVCPAAVTNPPHAPTRPKVDWVQESPPAPRTAPQATSPAPGAVSWKPSQAGPRTLRHCARRQR